MSALHLVLVAVLVVGACACAGVAMVDVISGGLRSHEERDQ